MPRHMQIADLKRLHPCKNFDFDVQVNNSK